jgi:hypothetical protein
MSEADKKSEKRFLMIAGTLIVGITAFYIYAQYRQAKA